MSNHLGRPKKNPGETILHISGILACHAGLVDYASPTSGEAYRDQRLTTNFELWVEIFCVLRHGNPIFFFFQKSSKFEFWLLTKSWNHLSFVNISPTLVIDTSIERSSRIVQHGNPKIWFFFQKSSKFEFWLLTKSWNHLSFVNISPTLVIDTSMEWSSRVLHHGNPEMWKFFKKFEIDKNWILSVPRVSIRREKKNSLASSISVLHE